MSNKYWQSFGEVNDPENLKKLTQDEFQEELPFEGFDDKGLDMLVSIYELVIEKEGETDLNSMSKVKCEVIERDNVKTRSELLDKVSKKV